MDQTLAQEILLSSQSALLTGPAGTGKTYVLGQFIRQCKADGKYVSVTATTGLAATSTHGQGLASTIACRTIFLITCRRRGAISLPRQMC